jgi:septation ring formation regulator EzrA
MKKHEVDELSLQLKHETQRRSVAEDNMKQLIEELRKANEEKESLKKQLTDQLTQGRWKLGYIFIVYYYSECSCF